MLKKRVHGDYSFYFEVLLDIEVLNEKNVNGKFRSDLKVITIAFNENRHLIKVKLVSCSPKIYKINKCVSRFLANLVIYTL